MTTNSNNRPSKVTATVEVIGDKNHPYNHVIQFENNRNYVYPPHRTLKNY